MRPSHLVISSCILLCVAATPALAQEVVHLKNGTFMNVRSHAVQDGMLHVTLGSDAQLAFPLAMVDRVESGGRALPLTTEGNTGGTVANRMVEGGDDVAGGAGGGSGGGMTGAAGLPSRSRASHTEEARNQVPSPGGIPITGVHTGQTRQAGEGQGEGYRPFAKSPNPNRRRVAAVGNRAATGTPGAAGKQRINTNAAPPRRFTPITLQPKKTGTTIKPRGESQDPGAGSDSGKGDS